MSDLLTLRSRTTSTSSNSSKRSRDDSKSPENSAKFLKPEMKDHDSIKNQLSQFEKKQEEATTRLEKKIR